MRTRPLILTGEQNAGIAEVIQYAKEHPLTLSEMFDLIRHPERAPGNSPGRWVILTIGYRCVFTFEYQPIGLCRHLSITCMPLKEADLPTLPSGVPTGLIAKAFGLHNPGKTWLEDVALPDGRTFQAFNLIQKE